MENVDKDGVLKKVE